MTRGPVPGHSGADSEDTRGPFRGTRGLIPEHSGTDSKGPGRPEDGVHGRNLIA